tara:strand:- start:254 stop:574 length:321 start_codon:yes stop_codon:yes gene_type:complete
MKFQKIVLYIALAVLIVTLVVVFMMLYYSTSKVDFPPVIGKCPDFFVISSDGSSCENRAGISGGVTWTNDPLNEATNERLCEIKNLLNADNLTWDGITNNDSICQY